MQDGVVIGGQAHGQIFDPEKVGPVLMIPKPIRLDEIEVSQANVPNEPQAYERLEYRLHRFHSTYGIERFLWRVWMPAHVKPHQAMGYLIHTALRAPAEQ